MSDFRKQAILWLTFIWSVLAGSAAAAETKSEVLLRKVGTRRGICVFVGLPEDGKQDTIIGLAESSELLIYVQCAEEKNTRTIREASEAAGLLGKRIWADHGSYSQIQMAPNLADTIFAGSSAGGSGTVKKEMIRVLRPGGRAYIGNETLVKPAPEGTGSWSHPYHGPDNNPLSTDRVARFPCLTQYLAEPLSGCISTVTVAAGGRVFMAFGHKPVDKAAIPLLNSLLGINAYNGTILWKRPLREGFMIHRNTMIATPETLYVGDDESCKLIDTRTGKLKSEIKPPVEQAGGTVWKWMALKGGTLYALLGGPEIKVERSRRNAGWGMWKGYDYKDPEKAFGFGRSVLAIEPKTGKVLWHHRSSEILDGRAVCMSNGRIYCYSPRKFLMCLEAGSGKTLWTTSDEALLTAIGPDLPAQSWNSGYSTTAYMKCNAKYLFFAGPQRKSLVVASAADGSLAWQKPGPGESSKRHRGNGNVHLVLRDEAVYAVGGFKLDYDTGKVLGRLSGKGRCTRATGSIDSIFFQRSGTMMHRYVPASGASRHITAICPSRQDGVIISDGFLHCGPWTSGEGMTMYGHVCLAPAEDSYFDWQADEKQQLETFPGASPADTESSLAFKTDAVGGIRALDPKTGKTIWKAYTGAGVNYPPGTWKKRVFAGSNDGRVYAFEAATGRLLWRFRAAPRVRRIPVHGELNSTWPVAGGVLADNGTVYAAAGRAHYDGTHVYALDAITGRIKWHNGSSGQLNQKTGNGVSLQGMLRLTTGANGRKVIDFYGGSAVEKAEFDAVTGKCLSPIPK